MKTKLKLFFGTGLLLPALVFAPVAAIAREDGSVPASNNPDQPQILLAHEGHEHEEDTNSEAAAASRKQRLEERKAALQVRLTFARQARLKAGCKAAQGKLSSIRGRIKGLETSRSQVYENLVSRLTLLSDKLEEKGIDTAELDAQIAQLTTLIETFNTDLAAYKQAVADIADMEDCTADPDAFQASLEAARAARAKTAEDAAAIRSFLADTVKPALQALKNQVGATETENGEDE